MRSANGYVLVGDSYSNRSVQFRDVVAVDQDHYSLVHPAHAFGLFKTEPVTFEGFVQATIKEDSDLDEGQNLTQAGYGLRDATQFEVPGEVYESPLQVVGVQSWSFQAKQWVVGPCLGTSA
jgi:hypothetical protein